jgi:hypothetical protein
VKTQSCLLFWLQLYSPVNATTSERDETLFSSAKLSDSKMVVAHLKSHFQLKNILLFFNARLKKSFAFFKLFATDFGGLPNCRK